VKNHVQHGASALLLLLTLIAPAGAAETPSTAPQPAPQAAPSPGILGTWISPQVTEAGILMILQIAPDATLRASLRSRAAVQYQLLSTDGTVYRLSFSSGDDSVEQTVEVNDNELTLRQPNQEAARTLTRIPNSPTGEPPFIGRWMAGAPGSSEIILIEYTEDGHLLFDLPVRTIEGNYTLQDDRVLIHWTTSGPSEETVELRWAGDELWGKDAAGEEHRAFRRFVPSADPGPSRVEPSAKPD
jgi:hypothetical protein